MKKSGIKQLFGVWANRDSELVITSKMIILYKRKETDFFSLVMTCEINKNQIDVFNKAIAYFCKTEKKASCKYFSEMNESWIQNGDELDMPTPVHKKSFLIIDSNNSFSIINDDEEFLKLNKNNNILTLNSYYSNNLKFVQIEKITVTDFKIAEKASENTIGKCLTEWSLGSGFIEDDEDHNFTVEIHTNQHSYIFSQNNWKGDKFLYCRAAKIRSNNNGSVFAQNIRLMKNNNEFTAKMVEDNLLTSKQDIVIQNDLFNPKSCVFVNDGKEIYWSLKDFSENEIILNGCAGEEYKHSRPKTKDKNFECYKYESYR